MLKGTSAQAFDNSPIFTGTATFPDGSTWNSSGPTLLSTDADATVGPVLNLFRNSASPAASDILGGINFTGKSSTGVTRTFVSVQSTIVTATNGAEDGSFKLYTMKAGTLTLAATFDQTGALTLAAGATLNGTLVMASGNNIAISGGGVIVGLTNNNRFNPDYGAKQFEFFHTTGPVGVVLDISSDGIWKLNDRSNAAAAVQALTYQSGAPSGGTAGVWKFGIRVAAVSALDTSQYLQVDVGGTAYKLALIS